MLSLYFIAGSLFVRLMEMTVHPMRQFFKKAGAKRVSQKAAAELARIIEERAKALAAESQRLAEHSGRRTVMRRDVKMARKNLNV